MATIRELLGDAFSETMTYSDIEKALSGKKLADLSSGEYVSKGKLTDYENRAKLAEKKLAERMTEEEKQAQTLAERESHYKALERENAFYKYKAELSKSISDSATLEKIATLYADGNYGEAIKEQSAYFAKEKDNIANKIKEELLHTNPEPAPQSDIPAKKANEYSMEEWNKLASENPQEYKKLLNTIK